MTDLAASVLVRRLSHDDLEGALTLSSTAGWNQRVDDWRMLLALAPAGAFAAVHEGCIVGTAMAVDYDSFSWIAMMLVDPAYRGRGLGRRLLEAALDAVPAEKPVRLDATPMGRPLYQAYEFEDECTITRCTFEASDVLQPSAARSGDEHGARAAAPVRPMTAADLAAVAEQDRDVFGGDRAAVLDWALALAPEHAWVLEPDGRETSLQYCLGRRGRLFDQIGPVVAANDEAAQALVHAALSSAPRRAAVMDVFDARRGFGAWVQASGFRPQRPLFRMRLERRRSAAAEDDGSTEATRVSAGRPAGSASPEEQVTRPGAARQRQSPANRLVEYAILGPEFA